MPWWRVNTKYSIHQVQHTLSTAYTEYSIHWVLHPPRDASSQDRLSLAPSQSRISRQTMLYSTLYIPTITCWPINTVSAPVAPPSQTTASRSTAPKSSCNLGLSWPQSASPNSLNHSFQVNLYPRPITASMFAQWWPASASTNSHDHGLQVHLQTRTITASKCISKLAQHSIRVYLKPRTNTLPKFAQSHHSSASPHSLDRGLQVHLQTRSITASESISNLARIRPPSSPNHGLQLYLGTCSMTASKCISNSLDYSLETRSIMALECIPKFTRTRCYEMVEIAWHPKGIRETEWF